MSQIDQIVFLPLLFWMSILFLVYYIVLFWLIIPIIYFILTIRSLFFNFFCSNSNNLIFTITTYIKKLFY